MIPNALKITYWILNYGSSLMYLIIMYGAIVTIVICIILIFSIYLLSAKQRSRQIQIAKIVRGYLEATFFILIIPFVGMMFIKSYFSLMRAARTWSQTAYSPLWDAGVGLAFSMASLGYSLRSSLLSSLILALY
jgi:hypothetical protein